MKYRGEKGMLRKERTRFRYECNDNNKEINKKEEKTLKDENKEEGFYVKKSEKRRKTKIYSELKSK